MEHDKDEKAVVLAWFGATYPKALTGITTMQREAEEAFPGTPVKVALTSNMIRRIWQERRRDEDYLAGHQDVPAAVLYAKGPLATIADLQDEGYKTIIVQPTFIYWGEEFADLASYIRGLGSIETVKPRNRPFKKLLLGRPLLGL
ncbi:MAG: cobalt chelatase, partial [Deltaproteobacteria bacterium]|nr:cobalt chelatase [Deltaproteobacteria bacterium]